MIGIDTNVLVRLLVGDDRAQQRSAQDFIADRCSPEEPAWIDRVVAVETAWVLERRYGFSAAQIAGAFEKLLETTELAFEDYDVVREAIARYRQGSGFADAIIAARNELVGCSTTITFDSAAAKQLPHFTLLTGTEHRS